MAMLFENDFFYGGYSSLHNFHLIIWRRKKEKGSEELDQLEHLSTKIQEVTSDVAITEKNEKQYVRLQLIIPGTQGAFLDKVTPDIDGFTDEPVLHQCDIQVVEYTFVDDSK